MVKKVYVNNIINKSVIWIDKFNKNEVDLLFGLSNLNIIYFEMNIGFENKCLLFYDD